MILSSPKTINDNTMDKLATQLNHQQTSINTIQATLVYHQSILDVQQNSIADIKTILADNASSINQIIYSLSEISSKLSLQISLPPLLPLSSAPVSLLSSAVVHYAAAPTISTSTNIAPSTISSPSSTKTSSLAIVSLNSIGNPSPINITKSIGFTNSHLNTSSPRSLLGSPPLRQTITAPTSKLSIFKSDPAIFKGDIDGDVDIKRGRPIPNQIRPDQFSFGFVLFEILCAGAAINPTRPNEQEFADAQNVFVEINKPGELPIQLKRYEAISFTTFYIHLEPIISSTENPVSIKILMENKIFIFDPGGSSISSENVIVVRLMYGDPTFYDDEYEKKISLKKRVMWTKQLLKCIIGWDVWNRMVIVYFRL